MNCVVPSDFYPFEVEDQNKKPDYIDGEVLIGETITVKAYNDDLIQDYNMGGDFVSTSTLNLPAIEYKLKVVGTYICHRPKQAIMIRFIFQRKQLRKY